MATRIINCNTEDIPLSNTIYIGRPSKWGNPFKIGIHGNRAAVIKKYEAWIRSQPQLLKCLNELDGKTLICYCKPKPCHGDVLIKLINELRSNTDGLQ